MENKVTFEVYNVKFIGQAVLTKRTKNGIIGMCNTFSDFGRSVCNRM